MVDSGSIVQLAARLKKIVTSRNLGRVSWKGRMVLSSVISLSGIRLLLIH